MTVSASIGQAVETETGVALFPPLGRAVETETANRMVSQVSATAAWRFDIVDRDGVTQESVSFTDTSPADQIAGFRMQWPLNDVGVGSLTVPLASALYDELVEHRFLHMYIRGAYVASCVVGVPTETVVPPGNQALAEFSLSSLEHVLNEGLVYPTRGLGVQPPGDDRIFDSSDPAFDISDWDAASEIVLLSDAQAGDWPLTPIADGVPDPASVYVIGPAGYDSSGDPPYPPPGYSFYAIDYNFVGGQYRVFAAGDDSVTLRIDATELISETSQFGRAIQFGSADSYNITLSAGVHRVWARVAQAEDPTSPGHGLRKTGLVVEICPLLANNQLDSPELVSDSSWSMLHVPSAPPGFTFPEIVELLIDQEQFRGRLADFAVGFTFDRYSNNAVAPEFFDVTTKTGNTIAAFLKEASETYVDWAVEKGTTGLPVVHLWAKGSRGTWIPITYTSDELSLLKFIRERTAMTTCLSRDHFQFSETSTTPTTGHPDVAAYLSIGTSRSAAETTRVVTPQLAQFGRYREKITLQPVVGPTTPDAEFPGLSYWVGDTLAAIPGDRDGTPVSARVISMTVELMGNGHLQFTPEFGDMVIDPESRPPFTLDRMAKGALGGKSRVPSQGSL